MENNFIVGTMRWGTWERNFNTDDAATFLTECYELGLKKYDLADIYGNYTTEKLFGDALEKSAINRADLYLISKCGILLPGGDAPYEVKAYNTSKKYILQQVDKTLANLKTDYLDEILIHRPNPLMDFYEIAEAFMSLKNSGKVKNFGVSNFSVTQFEMLNRIFPLKSHQVEISLTEPKAFFDDTLQQGIALNKEIQAWSPIGNYYQSTFHNTDLKMVVQSMAVKYKVTEMQILLAFIAKHPSQPQIVLGSTKTDRIKESVASQQIDLSTEDWFFLLEKSRGKCVD